MQSTDASLIQETRNASSQKQQRVPLRVFGIVRQQIFDEVFGYTLSGLAYSNFRTRSIACYSLEKETSFQHEFRLSSRRPLHEPKMYILRKIVYTNLITLRQFLNVLKSQTPKFLL